MNKLEQSLIAGGPGQCLNCDAALAGPFCSNCGQKARVNRSLAAFFSDLVAGLFNFESRFWRTLPMLIAKPGELTRRYVEGQRARFISPIALYLFCVFLMFAVLNASTSGMKDLNFKVNLDQVAQQEQKELGELEKQRKAAASAAQPTAELDRQIASKKEDIRQLSNTTVGIKLDEVSKDDPKWVNQAAARLKANPREAVGHVQEAASKYSWVLIPLSLPFMFMLFPLRPKHVFDHAVFVTYSLSFMMLLILFGSLLVYAGASAYTPFLLLVPPVHMYAQLRGAYRLRWWSAMLRTWALILFSFIALTLFVATILALGLLS